MPWSKVADHDECEGGEIAVVKDGDGTVEGCHATEEAADEQIAALEASEDREGSGEDSEEADAEGKALDDALCTFGGTAKALGDGKVGGYLIRFTEPGDTDIQNDFFTKRTDFGPLDRTVALYHHGRDETLGAKALDEDATLQTDDTGVWVEAQLDRRDRYEEAIYQMAKEGKLGWSSGTAAHLVERRRHQKGGYEVTRWPLGLDASLTPTPAEPRNFALPLKALPTTDLTPIDDPPGPAGTSSDSPTASTPTMATDTDTDETKAEGQTDEGASPLEQYKTGLITKNEYRERKGLAPIEGGDQTADEIAQKAGGGRTVTSQYEQGAPNYNRQTGLGDRPEKAFQHWVQTGDSGGLPGTMIAGEATPDDVKSARLHGATKIEVSPRTDAAVEAIKADQDMQVALDAAGGHAVPEGHFGNIIARRDEMMLADTVGVQDIPGQGTTVGVPIDDNADEDFVPTAEAATSDRDTPTLSNVDMTLVKYTKRVPLTNELMQDEASRLMSFIENYVGRGQAKTHNDLLVTEVETNGTSFTTFASNSAIAFGEPEAILGSDDLGDYIDDGDSVYWVTRNSTLWGIKSLSGADRQYDVQLREGPGLELLGYPVGLSNKVAPVGSSAASLLFGNFTFVGKREAPGFEVLRDPYSRASEGIVQLHYYFRTVYRVLQSEAVGYGEHPV